MGWHHELRRVWPVNRVTTICDPAPLRHEGGHCLSAVNRELVVLGRASVKLQASFIHLSSTSSFSHIYYIVYELHHGSHTLAGVNH